MKAQIFGLLIIPSVLFGQKLIDRSAYAHFYSSTPLEDIEAVNKKAMGVVDLSSGQVAVAIKMIDFEFDRSLMQEHFNENYVESDKYPKATFTGSIADFDSSKVMKLIDTVSFKVKGSMSIHGITNEVEAEVNFIANEQKLYASTKFILALEDYDIDIPKVVILNIAEEVEVTARFAFDVPK